MQVDVVLVVGLLPVLQAHDQTGVVCCSKVSSPKKNPALLSALPMLASFKLVYPCSLVLLRYSCQSLPKAREWSVLVVYNWPQPQSLHHIV